MISFTTSYTGIAGWKPERFQRLLERNARDLLNDLVKSAQTRVREPLPRHPAPSLYSEIVFTPAAISTMAAKIATDSPKAIYREEDTRPHEIRPTTKRALKFKIGRREVFATAARHPGTRGTHSWRYAAQQFRGRLPFAVAAMHSATFSGQRYQRRYK